MADNNNKTKTKLFFKNTLKGFTCMKNGKLNGWVAPAFFVLFIVPVYADINSRVKIGKNCDFDCSRLYQIKKSETLLLFCSLNILITICR